MAGSDKGWRSPNVLFPASTHLHLGKIFDTLATRVSMSVGISALAVLCAWAGLYVERSVQQLEEDHQVFSDLQVRNGFVSMSDIQRLLFVAQEAADTGGYTSELKNRFIEAADILFVRKDNFRRVLRTGETLSSAQDAIGSLEALITIADEAIGQDFTDPEALRLALFAEAEIARRKLVHFLDDMSSHQDAVLLAQSAAVSEQRIVVLSSLGGLTFVGLMTLFLLRREVMGRHARERAERDVEFLAYFDPLTNLPNRAQFHTKLEKMLKAPGPVALLLVDLDDFKGVNDTYGHAAGDAVLEHAASILQDQAKFNHGFAARLGGDEFALIIPTEALQALITISDSILTEMSGEIRFEGEVVRNGVSIGIATKKQLGKKMSRTVDSLSRVADFALYVSKSQGRGRFTIYDQTLESKFLERRSMIDALPGAIENEELEVYLQPKVTLPDQTVYGYEALVRWRREDRMVPPDDFINVAEESGLIFDIDRYMLRKSTEIVGAFNRRTEATLSVSVNLSALHFNSRRIVNWIEEALSHSGLDPRLLILEITETIEMRDWVQANESIREIRRIGARISIDDFGTGYSSFGHLQSTIVDEIKLDKSMVDDVEQSQTKHFVLSCIFDLARNLELNVVAEGVETNEQADLLANMGAARAQGYLFGAPKAADDALKDFQNKLLAHGGVGRNAG